MLSAVIWGAVNWDGVGGVDYYEVNWREVENVGAGETSMPKDQIK